MSLSAFVGRNPALYLTVSSQVALSSVPLCGRRCLGWRSLYFFLQKEHFSLERLVQGLETREQIQIHYWSGCMWQRWEKEEEASMCMSGISAADGALWGGRVPVLSGVCCVLSDVPARAAQAHLQSAARRDHACGEDRGTEADGRARERVVQPAVGQRGEWQSFQTQTLCASLPPSPR